MKKLALIAACVVLAGVAVKAEAPPVFSVNGVGYETFKVQANKSILLRIDFDKLDGTPWTIYELFGTNFTHDVTVLWWTSAGSWAGEKYYASIPDEWDPGTTVFHRGDSLFVRMFGSASETNTITIRGEIPGANNGATNTVMQLDSGLNTVGYAYPAPISISDTKLSDAANGDDMTVFFWNSQAGSWSGVKWYNSLQEWDPTDYILQPGQGYMIRKYAAGTSNWTETKPYVWP